MTKTTTPSVSVIIPCHNEAAIISRCLEALSRQCLPPLEVIVVDNNCIDETVKVAKRYGVRIVNEPAQGLIYARNTGFRAAKGDILAKLDADSLPSEDWVKKIVELFADKNVQGITGSGYFYDAPCKRFVKATRNLYAVWLNRLALGHHMLWGSNLALRASTWISIKNHCCNVPNLMEDLDLAIHINERYGSAGLIYSPQLRVDISARRSMVSIKRNWLYLKMWPLTLKRHSYQRRVILWPAVMALIVLMAMGNKFSRFYNAEQNRMIWSVWQWRNNPFYTRDNP